MPLVEGTLEPGELEYYDPVTQTIRTGTAPSTYTTGPAPSGGGSEPTGPTADDYYSYLTDYFNPELSDIPGTFDVMNELTASLGPIRYPGIENIIGKDVQLSEADLVGYESALELFARTSGGGGFVTPVPPPSFGGGCGGFNTATFSDVDINFSGAPDWWTAKVADVVNPLSEYQMIANLMIPLISPEDQYTVASNLFQSDPEQFAAYNPELLEREAIPTAITPEIRRQFFSGDRANKALSAFDQLLQAGGFSQDDFGPGYSFFRGLADTLNDFQLTSGASQLTEVQQSQLLSALDPQLAQTKGKELGAFGPLARSFVDPFFSAGALTSGQIQDRFGNIQYSGSPNPRFR